MRALRFATSAALRWPIESKSSVEDFIRQIPKTELHIHIEGSLEPELLFEIAQRNRITLRHGSIEALKQAYDFQDLQSFLDIYYEGARVLVQEQDFYDMAWAYLKKSHLQNVRHAEIFFDPQTHTERGIPFAIVVTGLRRALVDAERRLGISSRLIMCFLRHLSAESALETLSQARPFREWITGVGLDSSEVGNPPQKFTEVFARARAEGFQAVAHAGEEGPPDYIWQALDHLQVARIDHGVRCIEDPRLVARLQHTQIPLTVCPLSNVKLRVFETLEAHNLKTLLNLGLRVTINSDDPAYFGGHVNENYLAVQQALGLTRDEISLLARHSITSSFLDEAKKQALLAELYRVASMHTVQETRTR